MESNISSDLIWEVTRTNNSFLCKRRSGGGVQFSRDPMNLMNIHSKKYEGYAQEKAIGIQPGENGGVTLMTKKKDKANKPGSEIQKSTIGKNTSTRKTYRTVVNSTAKRGYRPDLRPSAVARASAVRMSQKPVKEAPPAKLRGAKARKAALTES